ncbi:hypothetical protein T484DRAFT_1912883, partial [Baffinella frigidus]
MSFGFEKTRNESEPVKDATGKTEVVFETTTTPPGDGAFSMGDMGGIPIDVRIPLVVTGFVAAGLTTAGLCHMQTNCLDHFRRNPRPSGGAPEPKKKKRQ